MLYMAVVGKAIDVVGFLLNRDGGGVEVDGRDVGAGETALHKAARKGHGDCVRLLLERGADIKAVNKMGKDAKGIAQNCGQEDVVRVLDEFEIAARGKID